jgi:hypothetical protein
MENKKRHRRVISLFIILIIAQFFSILFIEEFSDLEAKNALAEMQTTINNPNISVDEKAKMLFRKELENKMIACNIRNATEEEKNAVYRILNEKLEKYKTSNPDKFAEAQHELEVLKNGHTPISYIMEKILNLRSIKLLAYQKSYFFIILTFVSLIIYILYLYKSTTYNYKIKK